MVMFMKVMLAMLVTQPEKIKNKQMKLKSVLIVISLTLLCSNLFGQDKDMLITGEVSFVNSKNIYVKFENTKNIKIGDTLRFINQQKACLLVKNKSSKSVICTSIFNCNINKGDVVYHKYFAKNNGITVIESKKIVSTTSENIISEKQAKSALETTNSEK